jgi:hypothetical protein
MIAMFPAFLADTAGHICGVGAVFDIVQAGRHHVDGQFVVTAGGQVKVPAPLTRF